MTGQRTPYQSKFPSRAVLIGLFILQLIGAGYAIWHQQITQAKGEAFLFQTKPVDPRDPFRGQYVALQFEAEKDYPFAPCQQENYYPHTLYAELSKDDNQLATVERISEEKPASGTYLPLKHAHCGYRDENKDKIHITLPFDRYYANENEALALEKQARKAPDKTFLKVWVHGGDYSVDTLVLP